MIDCMIHTYATIKRILANMNFLFYDFTILDSEGLKYYSRRSKYLQCGKILTVIDVLKMLENRDGRSAQKYNVYFEDDKTLENKLHSNYGNPESDFIRQQQKNKLHELSQKIKNHKKYNELLFILNKERQDKKDENFLCYFKKSNNIKCSSVELLELVMNY